MQFYMACFPNIKRDITFDALVNSKHTKISSTLLEDAPSSNIKSWRLAVCLRNDRYLKTLFFTESGGINSAISSGEKIGIGNTL